MITYIPTPTYGSLFWDSFVGYHMANILSYFMDYPSKCKDHDEWMKPLKKVNYFVCDTDSIDVVIVEVCSRYELRLMLLNRDGDRYSDPVIYNMLTSPSGDVKDCHLGEFVRKLGGFDIRTDGTNWFYVTPSVDEEDGKKDENNSKQKS